MKALLIGIVAGAFIAIGKIAEGALLAIGFVITFKIFN